MSENVTKRRRAPKPKCSQEAVRRALRCELQQRLGRYFVCFWCRRRDTSDKLTLEHIQPRALGGALDESNIKTACKECNSNRGRITSVYRLYMMCLDAIERWAELSSEQRYRWRGQIKRINKGVDRREWDALFEWWIVVERLRLGYTLSEQMRPRKLPLLLVEASRG